MKKNYKIQKKKPLLFKMPWWFLLIVSFIPACSTYLVLPYWHVPNANMEQIPHLLDAGLHSSYFSKFCLFASVFLALASVANYLQDSSKRRYIVQRRSIDTIRNMPWQEFELLVGEVYRKQGYKVEEVGLGGADGGIDLIMRRGREKIIVQCKKWSTTSIGAPIIREMYGLMAHHKAHGVKVVCVGKFTKDAIAFAQGKPIDLVTGSDLIALINR